MYHGGAELLYFHHIIIWLLGLLAGQALRMVCHSGWEIRGRDLHVVKWQGDKSQAAVTGQWQVEV